MFLPEKQVQILVEVAKRYDGKDKNYVEAIGLGSAGKESSIWKYLKGALGISDPLKWDDAFARITWRLGAKEAINDLQNGSKVKSYQRSKTVCG